MSIEGNPGGNSSQEESILGKSNRRAFLKSLAVTAGVLLIGKKIFGEKTPPIPESEKTQEAPLRSPYFWVALNEIRKKHPEQEAKIREILERIDQEGVKNLAVFQPKDDENLQFPFTKVSVNKVIGPDAVEQTVSESRQKVIYMIFTGLAYPPGGHPFTAWDIVLDRVINSIPAIFVSGKNVEVYSLGYSQGLGGKVSKQWLERVSVGVEPYGKLYGEFVKGILAVNDKNTRVILQGMSFGGSIAELVFRNLDEKQRKNVRLLLDNPVADHNGSKALQIPAGFAGEVLIRSQYDPKAQSAMDAEEIFLGKYKRVLSGKGINWEDDEEQKGLKVQAAYADIWQMVKGIPLDTEKTRSFIRRGIWDSLSFPSEGFRKSLGKGTKNKILATSRGKALEFAIAATHFINRYRVDKWSRIMKNYLSK